MVVQWREYMDIKWEDALSPKAQGGGEKNRPATIIAASYCVRKGLSRKAQVRSRARSRALRCARAACSVCVLCMRRVRAVVVHATLPLPLQLWHTCRKRMSKHPSTILKTTVPQTVVVETWEAFDEDVRINLGGNVATFDSASLTVGQRLEWCLSDAKETLQAAPEGEGLTERIRRLLAVLRLSDALCSSHLHSRMP